MSTAPFCPIKWRTHFREMNAHTPPRGSSGGVAAYYAELVELYRELLAELLRVQVVADTHITNVLLALGQTPAEVQLIPQRELTDLARIVLELLRAQEALVEARRAAPRGDHRTSRWYAEQCEDRARAAARSALQREQQTLPGM